MKLETAVDEFLLANEADGLRATTIGWYRSLLKRLAETINLELEDVTTNHIRQYIADLGKARYSEDTINGHKRALHRFFRWCSTEYAIRNAMENIRYPKQQPNTKPNRAMTVSDILKMFEATEGNDPLQIRDRAILAMLTDTGARAAGIVGLHYGDLDMTRRRAVVNEKGGKLRQVVFTDFTTNILQCWLDTRTSAIASVFYNLHTGKRLTVSGLYQICRRIGRDAGVVGRFNPHAFRHGFAREYLLAGGDFATLSRLMGHSNVGTTASFYAVFTQDELAQQHEKYSPMQNLQKSKNRSFERF